METDWIPFWSPCYFWCLQGVGLHVVESVGEQCDACAHDCTSTSCAHPSHCAVNSWRTGAVLLVLGLAQSGPQLQIRFSLLWTRIVEACSPTFRKKLSAVAIAWLCSPRVCSSSTHYLCSTPGSIQSKQPDLPLPGISSGMVHLLQASGWSRLEEPWHWHFVLSALWTSLGIFLWYIGLVLSRQDLGWLCILRYHCLQCLVDPRNT